MKKLQLVSMIGLLFAMSANADFVIGKETYLIRCQQDPKLMGAATTLTIAFGDDADQYVATLEKSATTFPPQSSTQTFELTRANSENGKQYVYSGEGFKFTVSETSVKKSLLGMVMVGKLELNDEGTSETLYCQHAPVGFPAVTGSN